MITGCENKATSEEIYVNRISVIDDTYLPEVRASGFLERPPLMRAVPSTNYRRFILYDDISYNVGHSRSADRVTIRAPFITDFASIPRFLWAIWPPMGAYSAAAILHDFLYTSQSRTRRQSDDIFFEAMGVLGVGLITRYALYYGVRMGGWIPWGNKRKK